MNDRREIYGHNIYAGDVYGLLERSRKTIPYSQNEVAIQTPGEYIRFGFELFSGDTLDITCKKVFVDERAMETSEKKV